MAQKRRYIKRRLFSGTYSICFSEKYENKTNTGAFIRVFAGFALQFVGFTTSDMKAWMGYSD